MNNTQTHTTALTVHAPVQQDGDVYNRMHDPLQAVERLGEMIATSGMFGCQKIEQGQVLALQCMTERKAPLELAKTYHVIEGKLSMRADAMLAKFQLSGGTVKWTRRDDKVVEATFTLGGNSLPFRATLEEFMSNGVATGRDGKLKDNWRKFPRQMLTARVVSEAVRLLAPQVVFGVYTPPGQARVDPRVARGQGERLPGGEGPHHRGAELPRHARGARGQGHREPQGLS
ncbi:MAG: Verrucomicrobia phage [Verrucomicrobiota bacterium]